MATKQITVTPANPTDSAYKTAVQAVVFGAPTGTNLVGTVHKQFSELSFDSAGALTLDVSDVGALNANDSVRVYAENASESLSALLAGVVSSVGTSLDPVAWSGTGTAQNIALTIPGGSAVSGERLIIILALQDTAGGNRVASAAPTAQGSWNTVADDGFGGLVNRLYIYDREMTATLTTAGLNNLGGNTYAIATNENQLYAAAVIKCKGARNASVIKNISEFSSRPTGGAVPISVNGSTVIDVIMSRNWPRSYSPASGMTELVDVNVVASNGIGLDVSWSRQDAQIAYPAREYIMEDTGVETGDDYVSYSIVLDGIGGAVVTPPASGSMFLFGAHQHGQDGSFERFSGGSPFTYSVIRSHNAQYLQANGQHMGWWTGRSGGLNTYDWAVLDNWINYHKAKGRRVYWSCFGTPTFLARNTVLDAFGKAGGSSYVSSANRPAYRQFVTDTVNHIITTHGASILVGVGVWNEPVGGDSSDNGQFLKANGYPAANGLSSIQTCIADIHQDIYLGVRAASSTIPVIGFEMSYSGSNFDRIIAAKSTDGTPIYQFCDAFAFHPYGISDQTEWNGLGRSMSALKSDFYARLPATQRSKQLWATECAMPEIFNGSGGATFIAWNNVYNSSKANCAQMQYDWVGEFKAGGWSACFVYAVDNGWNEDGSGWNSSGSDNMSTGRQYLGLTGNDVSGAVNTQIAAKWTQANTDFHSWG